MLGHFGLKLLPQFPHAFFGLVRSIFGAIGALPLPNELRSEGCYGLAERPYDCRYVAGTVTAGGKTLVFRAPAALTLRRRYRHSPLG